MFLNTSAFENRSSLREDGSVYNAFYNENDLDSLQNDLSHAIPFILHRHSHRCDIGSGRRDAVPHVEADGVGCR